VRKLSLGRKKKQGALAIANKTFQGREKKEKGGSPPIRARGRGGKESIRSIPGGKPKGFYLDWEKGGKKRKKCPNLLWEIGGEKGEGEGKLDLR